MPISDKLVGKVNIVDLWSEDVYNDLVIFIVRWVHAELLNTILVTRIAV